MFPDYSPPPPLIVRSNGMNRDLLQYSFKAQAPDVIIVCDDKNKYPLL